MKLIDVTKLQKDIRRDLDEMSVMTDDFYKGANYVLSIVRKAKRVEAEPVRCEHLNEDLKNFLHELMCAFKILSTALNYEVFSEMLGNFVEDLSMKLDKMEDSNDQM